MEVFERRGREVAWERMGSGPPVILCHGTPWSSRVWVDLARGMARIVAHDLGGAVALRAHLLRGRAFAPLTLVNVVALRPCESAFLRLARAGHLAQYDALAVRRSL
jgi:pimeloyl-ACP methyl ester carboxylesterase